MHGAFAAAKGFVLPVSGRILVTGISGFLGSWLGPELRKRGWHVTGVSRSVPGEGRCDHFIQHDLAQPFAPDVPAFDVIVHGAALASPWAHPRDYQSSNVDAVRNIINFAIRQPPRRFIFISTSAVHYTFADQLGLKSTDPLPAIAINEYARTKRLGEDMVNASGLPATILRPRAVFGPGDTVVFPRILHAAKQGLLPHFIRRDGIVPQADLLYIGNLVHYISEVAARDIGGVHVLTNNAPIAIPDMLQHVLTGLGLPLPKRRVPVGLAMTAARVQEFVSSTFQNWHEPTVTRFGVASLVYSKTFDVRETVSMLGPPPVSLDEGMDLFIKWQRAQP